MANAVVSEDNDSWDDAWLNDIKEEDLETIEAAALQDIEDIPMKAPLHSMKRGTLWVSDLSSQIWCEQKLVYKLTLPVEYVPEPEHITVGKSIHLARELEVQDSVPVKITSKEDRFAIKLINLQTGIESFHSGNPTLREVPIFGLPFNSKIFVSGIIDELRFDVQSFEIDVVELKTRKEKTLPSESTTSGYRFQVMLYKKLLDDLIRGSIDKETIAKHLKLKLDKELGEDVLMGLRERMSSAWNLNKLFDQVLNSLQTIPCPNNMFIEYCHQADGQTFHLEPIQFDEQWLNDTCQRLFNFWRGRRKPEGVSVDDLWKCRFCECIDFCEWRKKKSKEFRIDIEEQNEDEIQIVEL